MSKFDFSGWATRNDLLCGDGRTIRRNAFKDNDGQTVPLIWNHDHANPNAIIGHALLKNREDGVYAYCTLNDTESGQQAKKLVEHGDVRSLSIYANNLKQIGGDVVHGTIRELSLVLAGANPGAFIDTVMAHGEDEDDAMWVNYDEYGLMLYHSDSSEDEDKKKKKKPEQDQVEEKEKEKMSEESKKPEDSKESEESKKPENGKTIADIIDTLNPEQKKAFYAVVGMIAGKDKDEDEDKKDENDNPKGGNDKMKHNLFDQEETKDENVLSHDAMKTIIGDAKRYGSLKESFLEHAGDYGIDNIDYLFPEAKNLNNPPEFIKRDTDWVQKVMQSVHHTPFSRIKSTFADITEDQARAKGYIKGNLKKEEVFSLLKRTTTPTTVYKKQKLDRDDVNDITDFDVVTWLKSEMRIMLDEEIARAILIGDGRLASDDDHINEANIRPIWTDEDLFTVKKTIEVASNETEDVTADKAITAIIKARKDYKGSGNPVFYTTEDFVTSCLLMKDGIGHRLYKTVDELATAIRASEIVTVPVMENATRKVGNKTNTLIGIMVNLSDYNVGADKGGAVNLFDDFDIDYNQQKYLIETRCSGALTKPFSAIVIESVQA